jgi:hypothetical protein
MLLREQESVEQKEEIAFIFVICQDYSRRVPEPEP